MTRAISSQQADAFLRGEGDQWFARNKYGLNDARHFYELDVIKRILAPFKAEIGNILEIGCGNGIKLNG